MVDVVEDEVVHLAAPGRGAGAARGGAALLAGDRVRRRRRSTPRRPRPAAPGTPGWSRWWSTPSCVARPTTRMQSRAAALGWGTVSHGRRGRRVGAAGQLGRRSSTRCAGAPHGCRSSRWRPCRAPAGRHPRRRGGRRPRRRRRWPSTSARARSWSGPTVPHLFAAGRSARAALSGLLAAPAWPDAPRPVLADDLLPERVLAGDEHARARCWSTGSTARWWPPAGRCSRPRAPSSTAAAGWRRRRGCCSSTPTPCATAWAGSPTVTGYDLTHPREANIVRIALAVGRLAQPTPRLAPLGIPRRDVDVRSRHRRLCRNPPEPGPDCWCRFGHDQVTTAAGRLEACSSRLPWTGLPDPRLPRRPGSSCPGCATGWAGSRPSPGSTWSPTAPSPTPRRSGHRRRPAADRRRRAGQPARPVRAPGRRPAGSVGATAGHSVGEITAAAVAGVLSAEQAMVFVRERGRAMAAASAVTPDRHERRRRRRPDEVADAPRSGTG